MNKKLNGFNNGRDTTDGVGGQHPIEFKLSQEDIKRRNKYIEKMLKIYEKSLNDLTHEEFTSRKEIMDLYLGNMSKDIAVNNPFNRK